MRGLLVGVSLINQWIGPILGYVDLGLSEEQRLAFAALQAQPQPLPWETIRAIIEADLGAAAAAELANGLRAPPVATGPIGQVHHATLPDGTPIAVKIRYPDIDESIALDLAPATLADRLAPWFQRSRQLDALVGQLSDRVLAECDYALAADRQERFSSLAASHATLVVPAVHRAHCSARVLTTTRSAGVSLDAYLQAQPHQGSRDRAGEALFELYLGGLFRLGLSKWDPDPRNYLFLPGGRVVIVDFGRVGELAPDFVARLAALTHALWMDDRELLARALADLDLAASGTPDALAATRSLLHAAWGPMLRDEVAAFEARDHELLTAALQRWRQAPRTILSAELFFLVRMGMGLWEVLGQLGARANWYQRLQTLLQAHPEPCFDVLLLDAGATPIATIRELRDATGVPLRDVELLVQSCPCMIREGLPRSAAYALRERLENAGARVEVQLARPASR
jgi:predicted unusual protein kinase regulating ubiquinone biosynthesis (AarF/ABC1/UbiB family)